MSKETAKERFISKLDKITENTGYTFEILPELFKEHIEENRLYAGWFAPNTVLAAASNGQHTINYTVTGGLDAALLSPTGSTVHTFLGKFTPFEDENIKIRDDKDIAALADGAHESGYSLLFKSDNKVRISAKGLPIDPVTTDDPSVARNILNENIVKELDLAITNCVKPEDILPDGRINERLDALVDAAEELDQLSFETVPDRLDPPAQNVIPFESDIPEWSETEEGKAFMAQENSDDEDAAEEPGSSHSEAEKEEVEEESKKPEKAPKKTNKSASGSKKKGAKAKVPDEEAIGRFDLLPLDIVSRILAEDFVPTGSKDLLGYIEDYKKSKDPGDLMFAAMDMIFGYFPSPTDFVMNLAVKVEKDAEECGEDAWKKKDITRCINEAIRGWLMYLKDGNEDGKLLDVAWSLMCASWVAKNA